MAIYSAVSQYDGRRLIIRVDPIYDPTTYAQVDTRVIATIDGKEVPLAAAKAAWTAHLLRAASIPDHQRDVDRILGYLDA